MSFTRAFTSKSRARNNYWNFISNRTREVSGKLTGVSRTFLSRTISRRKKCFREKKGSFAKFSYEKQGFWKNRLVAFEVKNARYISKKSIYIYTSLAKEEGTNFIQLSSFFNQLFRFLFSRTLVTFSSETGSFLDLAVST